MKDQGETSNKEDPVRPDDRFVRFLRLTALIAVAVGAVGSVGLMLNAGRNTPRFLLVLFVIWVLAPFGALAWANVISERWTILTRTTLYCVTLIIALGSLAIYGELVSPPEGSPHAFVWVVTPPASWLLFVIAVPIAALISCTLSRRDTDT
jgi:hypothetical protein